MTGAKVAVVALVLAAGCSQPAENIPAAAPAPDSPATTSAINTTVLAAPPTTESVTTTTEPEPTTVAPIPPRPSTTEYLRVETTTGACGGDLPPCYVLARESGGNIHVYNYSGSGASGKWQFMRSTWNNYRGYPNAADAPESVQDEKARLVWDGGRGCSHWNAC